jgi:uncharacterized membrane protein
MAATATTAIGGDALVEPHPTGLTRSGAARLDAIDMMRGLVIAIMVLDHVRDFFHVAAFQFDPTDPARSYPLLYATRWITHLCAPTFVFLSGVSIYLQKANGKTGNDLSLFLLKRGLWLILLEVTVVSFGWNFGWPHFLFLQVIWAIGASMVGMALLARLPATAVLAIGVAIVGLSPLVTPPFAPVSSAQDIVMHLLFGTAPVAGAPVFIVYAAVPWMGVMAIGFGLGGLFKAEPAERDRQLVAIGLALLVLFAAMRSMNGYGNPAPWHEQRDAVRTVMDFLNVFKYPPSPDFVAVTLGLSMLLFVAVARLRGPFARILGDYGRTPLFTYVAHIYIAHAMMWATAAAMGRPEVATGLFNSLFRDSSPPQWGFDLWVVYPIWLLVLAILVPLSRWFADVKRRRRDWWLSYL